MVLQRFCCNWPSSVLQGFKLQIINIWLSFLFNCFHIIIVCFLTLIATKQYTCLMKSIVLKIHFLISILVLEGVI